MSVPIDIAEALLAAASRIGPMAGRLIWYDETESTSTVAVALAERGVDEGCVVAADAQTRGRGRRGRVWASPPGAGIYASVVLRPSLRAAPLLTLAAGVAIAEGIAAATGLPCDLKWPNDVYAGGRKLAGILAEGARAERAERAESYVVVGFGINVRTAQMPPDVAARATSVEDELGRAVDRGVVLAASLEALWRRYQDVEERREREVLDAWRGRAEATKGRPIVWHGPEGDERGRMAGIDEAGALLMDTGERIVRVIAGEVEWI